MNKRSPCAKAAWAGFFLYAFCLTQILVGIVCDSVQPELQFLGALLGGLAEKLYFFLVVPGLILGILFCLVGCCFTLFCCCSSPDGGLFSSAGDWPG